MSTRKMRMAALVLAVGLSGAAQAALHDRGGGLIYDDVLNVTWLQDANYAKTSGYDTDGIMSWTEATTWAANLSYVDTVRNITYTDWRLPTTTDTGAPGMQYSYNGTDYGYNSTGSEMSHLFYTELGNSGNFTPAGVANNCFINGSSTCLDNVGPFANFQPSTYWSGTEYALDANGAWAFDFSSGYQDYGDKSIILYALAVRPGDVAAVPEPATYAMMLSGLGLLGAVARRRKQAKV